MHRSTSRGVLLAALLLLGAAPARADLQARLDARLRGADDTTFGALVVDAASGEVLYARRADEALVPASNMKLVTTAAALYLLGPDYAHETRVLVTAAPQAGVVRGHLVIRGGGDPTISRRFDPEPLLGDWADAVAARGVRRIEGDVVADDRFFDRVLLHPTWEPEDAERWYGAEVSALSLNDNCIDVAVSGSPQRVVVTARPKSRFAVFDVRATLIPTQNGHSWGLLRLGPDKRTIRVTGRVWRNAGPYESSVPVHEPSLFFATVLRDRLAERGIEVTGSVRRVRPGEEAQGLTLHARRAPLPRTLDVTNQRSQNFYAECLLKTLGRERGEGGTWPAGAQVLERWAEELGVASGEVAVADGSGLSRDGRLSARGLVTVMRHARRGAHGEVYRASLASPGEEGTLKRRLRELPPGADVRGKTGTLTGVSALSGFLRVGGREVVFAFIGNGGATGAIRRAHDAAVVDLARHLD